MGLSEENGKTAALTAAGAGAAPPNYGCQHCCCNVKLKNKILYKCGTIISKFFPLNENNYYLLLNENNPAKLTPGSWYKGTITNHYIVNDKNNKTHAATSNQQQQHEEEEEVTIWNEIQFDNGDTERLPQRELGSEQIRVLQRVPPLPSSSSSSSQKKRKRAAEDDRDGDSDGNNNNNNPVDSTIVLETFNLCVLGCWNEVHQRLQEHPNLGMAIYRNSTLLFHAICCAKIASSAIRTQIISIIIQQTPKAASITNRHGTLPIHAMCSRCVCFQQSHKDLLRMALIEAYPESILTQTKEGKTPLHILMGADPSQEIMEFMLQKQFNGEKATYMKDSKGRLPIHEAFRYNLKDKKYQMELLLQANPTSIAVKDLEGKTVLDLVREPSYSSRYNMRLLLSLVEIIPL